MVLNEVTDGTPLREAEKELGLKPKESAHQRGRTVNSP